jgi:proliferating cell nuclear antigen
MIFKIGSEWLLAIAKNLNLLNEFKMQVLSDGLRITEIDNANVCLIDVVLNKELFIEYNFIEKAVYCFNVEDFYKILKDNKKTNVALSIENNKAIFSFSNGIKSELSLIDDTGDIKPFPVVEYNNEIIMDSKKFKEIIKNLSNIGDKIIIDLKENILSLSSKNENNNSSIDLIEDIILKGTARSIYSLEYLKEMIKEQISEKVILKLNDDYPLTLFYELPYFKINYILAPIINED